MIHVHPTPSSVALRGETTIDHRLHAASAALDFAQSSARRRCVVDARRVTTTLSAAASPLKVDASPSEVRSASVPQEAAMNVMQDAHERDLDALPVESAHAVDTLTSTAASTEAPEKLERNDGQRDPTFVACAPRSTAPLERGLASRVRREFFAKASMLATRYAITTDDVLEHLDRAHLGTTAGPARVLAYVDDVVLATALVRGHPRAWQDAWAKFESLLVRACRMRLDERNAILFARRTWLALYAATLEELARAAATDRPDDLRSPFSTYVGVRPLRVWLTERFLGRLETEAVRALRAASLGRLPHSTRPAASGPTGQPRADLRSRRREVELPVHVRPLKFAVLAHALERERGRTSPAGSGEVGETRLRLVD
jgi:hypothetical protein